MKIHNGFFPFDAVDTNKDGLITFDEFCNALHPIEHSPLFNTGNLVVKKIYNSKVRDEIKKTWFSALWWLMVDSTDIAVNKEQYTKAVENVHAVGCFNENNDFQILDANYPRVQYVKEQYDKIKVNP